MDRWIKAGVIATILSLALQLWGTFGPTAGTIVDHPILLAMRYGSPVVTAIFLFAAVWIAFRRQSRRPVIANVDHAKLDRVNAELSRLNRFELFAVRRLCGVEGMTGEQFYAIVEQLGFPVATKPTQIEIVATFERIATKTPLVLRGAGPSPQWSIQSDARLYVKALAERAPLI